MAIFRWGEMVSFEISGPEMKNPAPCGAGFSDLATFVAYMPDRPAPVGEVIRTSTRTSAEMAIGELLASGMWQRSMDRRETRDKRACQHAALFRFLMKHRCN
ncbi:MAG: hypothetical protein JSR63_05855 [Proteobacteria bacterium]|nr:hypothetical protein [Pseudomonadota bacterium]